MGHAGNLAVIIIVLIFGYAKTGVIAPYLGFVRLDSIKALVLTPILHPVLHNG